MSIRHTRCLVSALFTWSLCSIALAAEDNGASNLQVLPTDIPRSSLNRLMLENLTGLGLPRREGEGCLYCHEGSLDIPRAQWDYAADTKLAKRKARSMMAMVQEINARLDRLEERSAADLRVTCSSCHAGRADPRPLPSVLLVSYTERGIEGLLDSYHSLRESYFGSAAYDFQENSLRTVATDLAQRGRLADALTIAELNEQMNPGLSTLGFRLTLQTEQQIQSGGLEAGVTFFEERWRGLGRPAQGFVVLDNLGWQYFRGGQQSAALSLFEHNLRLFPATYISHESLADALWNTGESGNRARARQIFLDWLQIHPTHALARRRLSNLDD